MPKMRLTESAVSRISKPKTRTDYFDTDTRGFVLRVSPDGSKSYYAMTRIKAPGQTSAGKLIRMRIGDVDALEVEDARDKARQAIKAAKKGNDPRPQKVTGKNPRVMETLFYGDKDRERPGYLDKLRRDAKPDYVAEVERIFLRDILPAVTGTDERAWQYRTIGSIQKSDIIELLDRKADTPYMHNRVLAALRAFFGWAEGRGAVDNPPSFRKMAIKEKRRERVPGFKIEGEEEKEVPEEVRAIWECANWYPFGLLVRFLLATGKRRDEAANVSEAEIDFEAGRWVIPAERAKGGRTDVVPLSTLALDILRQAVAERERGAKALEEPRDCGPFIFSTTHGDKPISGFSKGKATLDKRIARWWAENEQGEMPAWRLHDLRRTVASYIRELGFSRDVSDAVLGHVIPGVTGVYVLNPMTRQKADALSAWANKLRAMTGDTPDNVITLAAGE